MSQVPTEPEDGSVPAEAVPAESEWLGLVVTRPSPDVLVVVASGDIDLASLDRLAAVLWPRLSPTVRAVVVDLSRVSFLSLAGLELLQQARLLAQARGLGLRLVVPSGEVHRALTVAGLPTELPCFDTVAEAAGTNGGAEE